MACEIDAPNETIGRELLSRWAIEIPDGYEIVVEKVDDRCIQITTFPVELAL